MSKKTKKKNMLNSQISVRLSIEEQEKWFFWIWFFRRHPEYFIETVLDFLLTDYQRMIIRNIFKEDIWTICLCMSRGSGKDTIFAICSLLMAILYPKLNIGVVGRQFSDGQKFFDMDLVPHIQQIPAIEASIIKTNKGGHVHKSVSYWLVKFKNGSFVGTISTGSQSKSDGNDPRKDSKSTKRGFRFHVLFLNERKDIPQDGMKVYLNFANVKHPLLGTKVIHAGTVLYADDKWSQDVERYRRECKLGNHVYFIDVCILDAPKDHPRFSMDLQKMIGEVSRGEQSPDEAAAENLNIPIEFSDDLYLPPNIMKRCFKKYDPIFSSADFEVFLGGDPGRTAEAAIVAGRGNEEKFEFIWCNARSGLSRQEYSQRLYDTATDTFPRTVRINLDRGGGGEDTCEWLISPEVTKGDFPITLFDQDLASLIYGQKEREVQQGKQILHLIQWQDEELSNAFRQFYVACRSGIVSIPETTTIRSLDAELQSLHSEFRLLISQMTAARRVISHKGFWQIKMSFAKMKKDRLMAALYCFSAWKSTISNSMEGWAGYDEILGSEVFSPYNQKYGSVLNGI